MSAAGDAICRMALSQARAQAALARRHGFSGVSSIQSFNRGWSAGALTIAYTWLDADPDLAMAARNECRFLLGEYLDEGRS